MNYHIMCHNCYQHTTKHQQKGWPTKGRYLEKSHKGPWKDPPPRKRKRNRQKWKKNQREVDDVHRWIFALIHPWKSVVAVAFLSLSVRVSGLCVACMCVRVLLYGFFFLRLWFWLFCVFPPMSFFFSFCIADSFSHLQLLHTIFSNFKFFSNVFFLVCFQAFCFQLWLQTYMSTTTRLVGFDKDH